MSRGPTGRDFEAEWYWTGLSAPPKCTPYDAVCEATRLQKENEQLKARIVYLEKEIALVRASLPAQPAQSDGHK